MKLNLKFVTKMPKQGIDNEIIFIKQKNILSNYLKPIGKSIFSNKLFNEKSVMNILKDFIKLM